MKKIFFAFLFFTFVLNSTAQREFSYTEGDTTYTMKRYVFMMLNSGGIKSKDSTEIANSRNCT